MHIGVIYTIHAQYNVCDVPPHMWSSSGTFTFDSNSVSVVFVICAYSDQFKGQMLSLHTWNRELHTTLVTLLILWGVSNDIHVDMNIVKPFKFISLHTLALAVSTSKCE